MTKKRITLEAGIRDLISHASSGWADEEARNHTPSRVIAAFEELLSGYKTDTNSLFVMFNSPSDEMVICRNIEFVSVCNHHLLPFTGVAHVGYLPGEGGKVLGLSKIARVVDAFSRRLQLQERLTYEIANSINTGVVAKGVGVVMVAKHQCLSCRGARKADAEMVTSAMLGTFRSKPEQRAEFLSLLQV